MTMPAKVYIQYDACDLELYLPIFFENRPIAKIRQVFKLLEKRPYQNDYAPNNAFETFDQFFPVWEQTLRDQLSLAEAELVDAEREAENKRRMVSAMGSSYDEQIERAKERLALAKKAVKTKRIPSKRLEAYRNEYDRIAFHKTAYLQAASRVKRIVRDLNSIKAALKRVEKVAAIYKATREKSNPRHQNYL